MNYDLALHSWISNQIAGEYEVRVDYDAAITTPERATNAVIRRDGDEIMLPSLSELQSAWLNYIMAHRNISEVNLGAFVLTSDKTEVLASGLDIATISIDVQVGEYHFVIFLGDSVIADSNNLGTIDAVDNYDLQFSTSDAGEYLIRIIDASNTVKEITITATEII